jgi:hypothetical protein
MKPGEDFYESKFRDANLMLGQIYFSRELCKADFKGRDLVARLVVYDELTAPLLNKIDDMRVGIVQREILRIKDLDIKRRVVLEDLIDDEPEGLWDLSSVEIIFEA